MQYTMEWAGPSAGRSAIMTPYRAELSGLTSVLFLLLWICRTQGIEEGSACIYCNNISALNQVFAKVRPPTNPFKQMAADIDLIMCARDLLLQLPVDVGIAKEWVKKHYMGKNN